MNFKRFLFFLIFSIFCFVLTPRFSLAQTYQAVENSITNDLQTVSNFVNGQFAKSMGFISTLGWDTPPTVFDILGFPKVEVGLGIGADVMSFSGLKNLNLSILPASSIANIPAVLPFPFPVATVRIGLLSGLDLGFRYTDLPTVTVPGVNLSAAYSGWGLNLRYKILDGMTLPTVTAGLSWDTLQGHIAASTNVDQSGSDGTNSYEFKGTMNYRQNWDVKSLGANVMVGKSLGFFYPFAGIGFQRNSGNVYSSIYSPDGSLTYSNPGSTTYPFTPSAPSQAKPTVFEPKFTLGFDTGVGFHWGIVAESNGTDIAGSTSFRVQF